MTALPSGSCLAILNCDPWPDVYRSVPQPPPERISHPSWCRVRMPGDWDLPGFEEGGVVDWSVTFHRTGCVVADSTGIIVAEYLPEGDLVMPWPAPEDMPPEERHPLRGTEITSWSSRREPRLKPEPFWRLPWVMCALYALVSAVVGLWAIVLFVWGDRRFAAVEAGGACCFVLCAWIYWREIKRLEREPKYQRKTFERRPGWIGSFRG